MSFTLRQATQDDAAAIAAAQRVSWREAYSELGIDRFLGQQTQAVRTAAWVKHLAPETHPNATFVCLDRLGEVVAFCSSGPSRREAFAGQGEIYALYCVNRAQGRGLGKALMVRQAQHLRALGYAAIFVRTLQSGAAKHFYQHLGGVYAGEGTVEFAGVTLPDVIYAWGDVGVLAEQAG